jgi:hypothetical protein
MAMDPAQHVKVELLAAVSPILRNPWQVAAKWKSPEASFQTPICGPK